MSDTEQRVRERAYQLWEAAGCPHDRGAEFWHVARQEIEDEVPPLGDAPGGAIDFPPDERSVEDPPELAGETTLPDPPTAPPGRPLPDEAAAAMARMAVPDVHPMEPDAAEATVPHEPAPAEPERAPRPSKSVATSAARKAADVAEEPAPSRRPRTGAARPPASRPTPSRPVRK